jgi:hypothetical protein
MEIATTDEWNTELIQMQQYYETLGTIRGGHVLEE